MTPRIEFVLTLAPLLVCTVLVTACGTRDSSTTTPTSAEPTPTGSTPETGATVMADDVPALPVRAVCVEQPDGTFRSARVRGSIAGVYDNRTPLLLAHLNWMPADPASESALTGCVTYPGASTRTVACGSSGEATAPVVSRTLCQQ